MSDPIDRFYDCVALACGVSRERLPGAPTITADTPVRLVGVSVGELAHALRFSGLIITSTGDGVHIRKQGESV